MYNTQTIIIIELLVVGKEERFTLDSVCLP